jgi:hypothetical protein
MVNIRVEKPVWLTESITDEFLYVSSCKAVAEDCKLLELGSMKRKVKSLTDHAASTTIFVLVAARNQNCIRS